MFRVISSVLGLIGALVLALRGFYMRSVLNDPMAAGVRAYERATGGDTSAYDMIDIYSTMLLILAALGALGGLLLLLRVGSPKALAILIVVAALIPFVNAESGPYAAPMLLAGVLAFFVRKKAA